MEKIKLLNDLGFYWGTKNTPWEERLNELIAFKLRFGHCDVPQHWKENTPLSSWVNIQRRKFKQGRLSPKQLKLLEDLEFQWKIKYRRNQ